MVPWRGFVARLRGSCLRCAALKGQFSTRFFSGPRKGKSRPMDSLDFFCFVVHLVVRLIPGPGQISARCFVVLLRGSVARLLGSALVVLVACNFFSALCCPRWANLGPWNLLCFVGANIGRWTLFSFISWLTFRDVISGVVGQISARGPSVALWFLSWLAS